MVTRDCDQGGSQDSVSDSVAALDLVHDFSIGPAGAGDAGNCFVFARVERPYGMRLYGELSGTNDRVGQVLLAADSEEEFTQRLADIRAWFDERMVVVPEGGLNRELRAWQRRNWPDADFSDRLWSDSVGPPPLS